MSTVLPRPYRLTYCGPDTANLLAMPVDLSRHIESIDSFTDVGTGETVSARITIDARFGHFLSADGSGSTPIVKPHYVFLLEVEDAAGNLYKRYLIQDDKLPQLNVNGTHVILELFGREQYLRKMPFTGRFFFASLEDMIVEIVRHYNANKGTNQPGILVDANGNPVDTAGNSTIDVPTHAYGTFDFREPTMCYDALMEIIRQLTLPEPAGGGDQYYGLTFEEGDAMDKLVMHVHPQGANAAPGDPLSKPLHMTRVQSPEVGNIVVVKGQPGSGSLPREPALFRSLIEEYENLPIWKINRPYSAGAYVRHESKVYQRLETLTSSQAEPGTAATVWEEISFRRYVRAYIAEYHPGQYTNNDIDYSPWTKNRASAWKNMGGNPATAINNSFTSPCFPDSNLVIRDRWAWRDWVDCKVGSLTAGGANGIPTEYLYSDDNGPDTVEKRAYYGFRVLLDAASTETDQFGRSFARAMLMMDRDNQWIVIRTPHDHDECVVLSTGRTYEYTDPTTGNGTAGNRRNRPTARTVTDAAWRETTEVLMGNDAFHYYKEIVQENGLIGTTADGQSPVPADYTNDSAIRIKYAFGESDAVSSIVRQIKPALATVLNILGFDGNTLTADEEEELYSLETYTSGWWAVLFEAPFPKSSHNGQAMGSLFGGPSGPHVLDVVNLTQTPSGKTGFKWDDSDLLGPIDGIKLFFKFDITGLDMSALTGNIPFRLTIDDIFGNVWYADTQYRFQGDAQRAESESQELEFTLGSFGIYRARIPVGYTLSETIHRIINPELKITELFQDRAIKRIKLQCMLSYDDQGRYDPWTWEGIIRKFVSAITMVDVVYDGIIDAFHFTKTPVAIARHDPTGASDNVKLSEIHLAAPVKNMPNISNVSQLQKIANSELAIALHRADTWTAMFTGRADVKAEDSVYIKDANFVEGSERVTDTSMDPDTTDPNTRKLIVKKITYSVGSAKSGAGLLAAYDMFREVAT